MLQFDTMGPNYMLISMFGWASKKRARLSIMQRRNCVFVQVKQCKLMLFGNW
jgi:hypothetical protein